MRRAPRGTSRSHITACGDCTGRGFRWCSQPGQPAAGRPPGAPFCAAADSSKDLGPYPSLPIVSCSSRCSCGACVAASPAYNWCQPAARDGGGFCDELWAARKGPGRLSYFNETLCLSSSVDARPEADCCCFAAAGCGPTNSSCPTTR